MSQDTTAPMDGNTGENSQNNGRPKIEVRRRREDLDTVSYPTRELTARLFLILS